MTGIYKIENTINGKVYIGQARDIFLRWDEHKDNYINHRYDYCLYKAFDKYGFDNFKFSVLEECEENELCNREKYWIQYFHSYLGDENCNGYNMTLGGEGNATISRDTVYELWDQGMSIQQIVDTIGHDRSAIRSILKNYKNYSPEESHLRGDKIQGMNRWNKVLQYTLQGHLINVFNNMVDAEMTTNISSKNIWAAVSHCSLTAGGYQWRYEGDPDIPQDIENKARKYKQAVYQFDKDGTFVADYESASMASKITGISDIQIRKVCSGEGMTAGGYIWKYKKEGDVK